MLGYFCARSAAADIATQQVPAAGGAGGWASCRQSWRGAVWWIRRRRRRYWRRFQLGQSHCQGQQRAHVRRLASWRRTMPTGARRPVDFTSLPMVFTIRKQPLEGGRGWSHPHRAEENVQAFSATTVKLLLCVDLLYASLSIEGRIVHCALSVRSRGQHVVW